MVFIHDALKIGLWLWAAYEDLRRRSVSFGCAIAVLVSLAWEPWQWSWFHGVLGVVLCLGTYFGGLCGLDAAAVWMVALRSDGLGWGFVGLGSCFLWCTRFFWGRRLPVLGVLVCELAIFEMVERAL